PNLGLVLNGPVVFRDGSPEPFVTGRIIFNGVISGDTFINVTGDASDVVLTANNTVRGVGAQGGTLRIEGSIPNIGVGGTATAAGYLRGSGSAGNMGVGSAGVLDPGTAGPGTLHATSLGISFGTYSVDVAGSAPGAYDQVIAANQVQILGGTLALHFG